MTPACAQACPTESIQFGDARRARERGRRARGRAAGRGRGEARGSTARTRTTASAAQGSFFLLLDEPEVYGLPPDPVVDAPATWARCGAPRRAAGARSWRAYRWARASRAGGDERRRLLLRAADPQGSRCGRGRSRSTSSSAAWRAPSAPLAAVAELRGDEALARRAWLVALGGVAVEPAAADRRPRAPGALPQHAARVQADLADERRLVDPRRRARRSRWPGADLFGRFPRLGRAARRHRVLGPALSTYTAVLLADTAIPAWHDARRELPFVFAAGAAMSAGSALALAGGGAPARRLALAGAVGELAATTRWSAASATLSASPTARASRAVRQAVQGAHRRGRRHDGAARRAARRRGAGGALMLGGALATRWSVFHAGLQGAADPKYVVEPAAGAGRGAPRLAPSRAGVRRGKRRSPPRGARGLGLPAKRRTPTENSASAGAWKSCSTSRCLAANAVLRARDPGASCRVQITVASFAHSSAGAAMCRRGPRRADVAEDAGHDDEVGRDRSGIGRAVAGVRAHDGDVAQGGVVDRGLRGGDVALSYSSSVARTRSAARVRACRSVAAVTGAGADDRQRFTVASSSQHAMCRCTSQAGDETMRSHRRRAHATHASPSRRSPQWPGQDGQLWPGPEPALGLWFDRRLADERRVGPHDHGDGPRARTVRRRRIIAVARARRRCSRWWATWRSHAPRSGRARADGETAARTTCGHAPRW